MYYTGKKAQIPINGTNNGNQFLRVRTECTGAGPLLIKQSKSHPNSLIHKYTATSACLVIYN